MICAVPVIEAVLGDEGVLVGDTVDICVRLCVPVLLAVPVLDGVVVVVDVRVNDPEPLPVPVRVLVTEEV